LLMLTHLSEMRLALSLRITRQGSTLKERSRYDRPCP
jgi:hypothetical protein